MKKSKYKNKINNYYKSDCKEEVDKTFFDKLFLKIFLSSLLLLIIVGIDKISYNIKGKDLIRNMMTENINFIKYAKKFNNSLFKFIDDDTLIEVYDVTIYENVKYENGVNRVLLNNQNSVINLVSGYVSKIIKENDSFTVTIKGLDGIEYEYIGLNNIDVSIYQYVVASDIIGEASVDPIYEIYFFNLIIKDQNGVYSYYEKAD